MPKVSKTLGVLLSARENGSSVVIMHGLLRHPSSATRTRTHARRFDSVFDTLFCFFVDSCEIYSPLPDDDDFPLV